MEVLTDKEIKSFLETAPLYTWAEFKKPHVTRSSLWIEAIDSFCEKCGMVRPFHDMRSRGGGTGMAVKALSTGTSYFEFTCVTCRKERHEYLIEQTVGDKTIKIQKYGQLPRKHLERDRTLQKFFSDDSENYEKAIVCLSHGYGIAAFAYLRRIVENNTIKLIDLVLNDVQCSEPNSKMIELLSELRKESPMSDKIKIANEALPEYLKPDGLNPLGRLYQVLSEGVHSLSDEECLNRANIVKECLKYLISELSSRKKNRRQFKSMIGSL
ncbi:hypothetical protein [Methylocucumis oryzae]|uniref:DUF4145 domain-containing protein n=1 Tax=Methylocucumis oryzae TaxID=1632867 RepID=A0A0F3IE24_9GAMM|nr:hypothetical protein [Methylocucumis oryzae]KJV05045.1 hypothetical protein VZ94_21025 [Methylocucumis oryzae]